MSDEKIIPFDDLESIPLHCSRDGNRQTCRYKTSIDDSTLSVFEHTSFPSIREIVKSVYEGKECPETKVKYSVWYGEVTSEDSVVPLPEHAILISIESEPYYNSKTEQYDFSASVVFGEDNFLEAYQYAITHKPVLL